ncbi:DUF4058 family protein [Nodosilinea sp. P-1105]|uniref:DUF4058 family protein n=1 Tax=Nodosilinea sp. P-1105 TaxID=2546229 RepID=UPI00146DEE48|nr:DUF4058 family protein [Nodosilinea sp. P-1105]NMF86313.1 DUF4058 family protein [Nodosilinea sp. P-1105]
MSNPFPGANPYLEQPDYWSDFHNQLVAEIARALIPQVLPNYRVVMDKWVYKVTDSTAIVVGRPDVAVQRRKTEASPSLTAHQTATLPVQVRIPMPLDVEQAYLEVKDAATQEVITAIEVLSPANKTGEGRAKYDAKRQAILGSKTHLIEIDLLRAGQPLALEGETVQSHYKILVSRSQQRPIADLYPFNLADPMPSFPVPLRQGESEPIIQIQDLVNGLYEQLGYSYFIDYSQEPPPPWTTDEVAPWLGTVA